MTSNRITIDRDVARAAMHPALHDLGVTIPGVPGDCHCNLISEVVVKAVEDSAGPRPEIVTLCGSTRFKDEINAANARLTLAGKLVISLGVFGHTDLPDRDWTTGGSDDKRLLDDLHKRKIDLADRVFVVNVGGYVGESTRSEIEYAQAHGKPVDYLFNCPDCGRPVAESDGARDTRHDHCGPLPHTGPVGGPTCERCR